jgi:hypothetical protein
MGIDRRTTRSTRSVVGSRERYPAADTLLITADGGEAIVDVFGY